MTKNNQGIPRLNNIIIIILFFVLCPSTSFANNLTVSNVSLDRRNPTSHTVVVKFDASWENSWKNKSSHDAIWLTVRLHNPSSTPTDKKLCQISSNGLNPTGSTVGSNASLEIYVPADKLGAFLRPTSYGTNASVTSSGIELTIDYSSCGFTNTDSVKASVFGLEMVYIPQGEFYAGDRGISVASFDQGISDSDPWYINSELAINISNPNNNGFRYVSAGNVGEYPTNSSFSISNAFPKGYSAFYAMKYEITEGQWVEFVNSLPSAARLNHDLTDNLHKNTDTVKFRNTISCTGSPLTCSTNRPSRNVSYLDWVDLTAFLDWDALRPMTELEFEKMSRGPVAPNAGEFAWGNTTITSATSISGSNENGSETITNSGANAHYNNTTLVGGDANAGPDYQQGPLRSGIFATNSSTRESAGAGYYGVLDLSGNLKEQVVTVGNSSALNYLGQHGDGTLSSVSGYEGNADVNDWPGMDPIPARGITTADGSGLRGGSWSDASSGTKLMISDRSEAALAVSTAENNVGGRGVRTYDGN